MEKIICKFNIELSRLSTLFKAIETYILSIHVCYFTIIKYQKPYYKRFIKQLYLMDLEQNEQNFSNFPLVQPLVQQITYPLHKAYLKILAFCPMINSTFAIMVKKDLLTEGVVYISSEGQVLRQIYRQDWNINNLSTTRQHTIIWTDIKNNLIYQWNIFNQKPSSIPFKFIGSMICNFRRLQVFTEINALCVEESGKKCKLTYMSFPLIQNPEPICVFQPTPQEWDNQCKVMKGNQKSMMIWFKTSQTKILSFFTHQLTFTSNIGRKVKSLSFNTELDGQFCVPHIWQMKPSKYLIRIVSKQKGNLYLFPSTFYIAQAESKSFRPINIHFKSKQIAECFSFGNLTVIKLFEKQSQQAPVYAIDNKQEKLTIVGKYNPKKNIKYSSIPYDKNLICEGQYENKSPEKITIRTIRNVDSILLFTHMLSSLSYEMEEDLVEQSIKLLQASD